MADEARTAAPILIAFARWLLLVFFRRVEVAGAWRLPEKGPVVFVANHVNSLVDPALLLGFLHPPPRFLGKSTLWDVAILKPFIRLAAAIPVYRRQDPGVDPARNAETFARCHEVLAEGGSIAIFPEGTSHNQPGLVELKTGVSRIVLQAAERFPGLGVVIVPVGLIFDDKDRFRSRVLINVGDPLDPSAEISVYGEDPQAAVRQLTDKVRQALLDQTLNFPSWKEARLIERAAEIYSHPAAKQPRKISLSEAFHLRRRFIDGYSTLEARYPDEVAELAAAVETYDGLLQARRLDDDQVASQYPPSGVLRFTARSAWLLLVRFPLAAVGTVLNVVPFHLAGWFARRRVDSEDVVATYKLLASIVFYPASWIALAAVAGWLQGAPGALAVLVVAPISGSVALRFFERKAHFLRQARAFFLLEIGKKPVAELRALRQEVVDKLQDLAQVYLAETEMPPAEDLSRGAGS